MKDLSALIMDCRTELNALKIPIGNIVRVDINDTAKSRWGLCSRLKSGAFKISISKSLLQDKVSDKNAKQTLLHEMLHTAKDCFKHTGQWKVYANMLNRAYGYNIKRTNSADEMGLPEMKRTKKTNYAITCQNCGYTYNRQRMSVIIDHPERYRCGKCGGNLKRTL